MIITKTGRFVNTIQLQWHAQVSYLTTYLDFYFSLLSLYFLNMLTFVLAYLLNKTFYLLNTCEHIIRYTGIHT